MQAGLHMSARNRLIIRLCAVLLTCLLLGSISAVAEASRHFSQIQDLSFYRDLDGTMQVSDLQHVSFSSISDFDGHHFGHHEVYWVRFELHSNGPVMDSLLIEFFGWADVRLYTVGRDDPFVGQSGYLMPYVARDFPFLNRSLIRGLATSDGTTYYARLTASLNHVTFVDAINIGLTTELALYEQYRKDHYLRVFNNGFLLCLMVFLLFLFFLIKDLSFFFCSIYMALSIYTNYNNSGEIVEVMSFFESFPQYIALLDAWVSAGTMVVAVVTIYYVLDFDTNFLKEKKVFNIMLYIFLAAALSAVFITQRVYVVQFIYALMLLSVIGIFYITYFAISRKVKYSLMFSIANVPFILGAVYYLLYEIGVTLPFGQTDQFMIMGTFVQSFLFAMIFSLKFSTLVKQNDEKQKQIILKLQESQVLSRKWKEATVKAETLEKEKAISQYEVLKNQVSPHFLFNSLSVLTQIVYDNQEKAATFIHELASVYRYILGNRNRNSVSLQEELDCLHSYIFLIKIRFPDAFELQISLTDEELQSLVPPLVLQMLIENAIKHNVVDAESPLKITLYTKDELLFVRNNLNLRSQPALGTKVGINNIKSRYRVLAEKEVLVQTSIEYFEVGLPLIYDH